MKPIPDIQIELNRESINPYTVNDMPISIEEFDELMSRLLTHYKIDITTEIIENPFLRRLERVKNPRTMKTHEFHFLEHPAGEYTVRFKNGKNSPMKTMRIKFPYTLIIVKFAETSKGLIRQTDRMFFLDSPLDEETLKNTLYEPNLSNVYKDFNICWGDASLPYMDRNSSQQIFIEYFSRVKNNDLWNNSEYSDWAELSKQNFYEINVSKCKRHPYKIPDVVKQM